MKPRRDLVFVSAGLGLDGGGRAMAGRLLAGGCAGFARGRRMGFRLLTLDGSGLPDGEAPVARLRGGSAGARARGLEAAAERPRIGLRLRPSRTGADAELPARRAPRPLSHPPLRDRGLAAAAVGPPAGARPGRRGLRHLRPHPGARPAVRPRPRGRARRPPGPGGAQAGGGGGRPPPRPPRPRLLPDRRAHGRPRALQGARPAPGSAAGARPTPAWWWPATATTARGWRRRRRGWRWRTASPSPASPARRRSPSSTGAAPPS